LFNASTYESNVFSKNFNMEINDFVVENNTCDVLLQGKKDLIVSLKSTITEESN
jgi:hypothetical protein